MEQKPIGTCSLCGGDVCLPTVWWSVLRPMPACIKCDAVVDHRKTMPEIPMCDRTESKE